MQAGLFWSGHAASARTSVGLVLSLTQSGSGSRECCPSLIEMAGFDQGGRGVCSPADTLRSACPSASGAAPPASYKPPRPRSSRSLNLVTCSTRSCATSRVPSPTVAKGLHSQAPASTICLPCSRSRRSAFGRNSLARRGSLATDLGGKAEESAPWQPMGPSTPSATGLGRAGGMKPQRSGRSPASTAGLRPR